MSPYPCCPHCTEDQPGGTVYCRKGHTAPCNRCGPPWPEEETGGVSATWPSPEEVAQQEAGTYDTMRKLDGSLVFDPVNHPSHYRSHPSGVECITVTEHMNFCVGNAMKYLWRAGLKDDALEDLRKSLWYIQREIDRRTREGSG